MILPITFIGDVHALVDEYLGIIARYPRTFQLGDFGFGEAPGWINCLSVPPYSENHRILRGNHDSPAVAHQVPQCLADWGEWNGVFYVAGADSIDKKWRTPGKSWWPDEELSQDELTKAIAAFEARKPEVVESTPPTDVESVGNPRPLWAG
jgi:hypothetical protein